MVMWLDLLTHVVVLMLHIKQSRAFTIFFIDCIYALLHICLFLFIQLHVMVADDI